MERITLNNKAVQNEFILNPSTSLEHNKIINAFMANKNNPNVTIVTGKVNSTKIGLINMLSNPKTTATINAVVKSTTVTLVIKLEISKTKPAVIRILKSSFISSCY